MSRQPFGPHTCLIAASTALTEGDAKTSPQTAALSMPSPTNPACAGSWPEPPPEMSATLFLSTLDRSVFARTTTFTSGSPSSN